jgi:hypothetical protein
LVGSRVEIGQGTEVFTSRAFHYSLDDNLRDRIIAEEGDDPLLPVLSRRQLFLNVGSRVFRVLCLRHRITRREQRNDRGTPLRPLVLAISDAADRFGEKPDDIDVRRALPLAVERTAKGLLEQILGLHGTTKGVKVGGVSQPRPLGRRERPNRIGDFGRRPHPLGGLGHGQGDAPPVVFQATFLEGTRQTRALFMSDIDHEAIEQIVKTSKRHNNEERLLWDIFKVPHHCSYTAIGPDKGEDETKPTDEVKWLYETQGQERHTMMSTSKSIPIKGSNEDKDVQPPHRQAAAYYKRVANAKDGQFKVTMDLPSASKPKPTKIEITDRGARLLTVSATVGAASIVSTPARAG